MSCGNDDNDSSIRALIIESSSKKLDLGLSTICCSDSWGVS